MGRVWRSEHELITGDLVQRSSAVQGYRQVRIAAEAASSLALRSQLNFGYVSFFV